MENDYSREVCEEGRLPMLCHQIHRKIAIIFAGKKRVKTRMFGEFLIQCSHIPSGRTASTPASR